MKIRYTLCLALCLGLCFLTGFCQSFTKSGSYTDGTFSDVSEKDWYSTAVGEAYEFGIMNGNSGKTFNPDGVLSVSEGITIAARLDSVMSGTSIPEKDGEWYEKYVSYAVSRGLMKREDFDSLTSPIRRFEIAGLLYNACKGSLEAINDVDVIPDVPSDNAEYEGIISLYRAGILTGSDDYGSFCGSDNLRRCEMAAMAVRIADFNQRVNKSFEAEKPRSFSDAYTIIDVPSTYANSQSASKEAVPNGWYGDNRFLMPYRMTDSARFLSMLDASEEKFYALNRDFSAESDGVITSELVILASGNDGGVFVSLQNEDGIDVVRLSPKNGVWSLYGCDNVSGNVKISADVPQEYSVKISVDLDKNIAEAYVNNEKIGSVFVGGDSISRLKLGTTRRGVGSVTLNYARMWKNRVIDEHFIAVDSCDGKAPVGWETSGSFALKKTSSQKGVDLYSMYSKTKSGEVSKASKSFETLSGAFSLEAYVLFPEKVNGAKISFTSGGREVFTLETKNDSLMYGSTVVNDYIPNIWQALCIDADTNTGKATIKVNGKKRTVCDFEAQYIDGFSVVFSPDRDSAMWFDDVLAYPLVSHDDYPSYPVVAESKDYNIGVNVCWLWHDFDCGEGWDSISAFPEFEPYLGYYDEGSREYADWELKQLAEHGIDFVHVCWYSPNSSSDVPIKNEDFSFSALHDGYMNAKYSDLVDFCIMWENSFRRDENGLESFKNRLWNYWVEYYFKDPRYLRLDNKAVLTIFKPEYLENTFGSAEQVKKAVEFMNEDIKKYGYDGIILLSDTEWYRSYSYLDSLGFDGTYAYSWGREGADGDVQISQNRTFDELSVQSGLCHIPTVSVGFNAVARGFVRSDFISEAEHLKVCKDIKKQLDGKNDGTWKSNTLMVSTWNEYSEGHFVAPTESIGFSLLENIRKTFTDDKTDHSVCDAKPTQAQKDRINHMYPQNHSPLRRLYLENDVPDTAEMKPVKVYDMSVSGDTFAWKNNHNVDKLRQEDGVLKGQSEADDYGIALADSLKLDAASVDAIRIVMKSSEKGKVQLFFATQDSPSLSSDKCITLDVEKTDEFVSYDFAVSSNTLWSGNVTNIRIDPLDKAGSFEIAEIDFLSASSQKSVYVNGSKVSFAFSPKITPDGDIEAAIDADFLLRCGLYYEWDRFTGDGVLKLYSRNDDSLVLYVGKDTALSGGKEIGLGYTIGLRDGLPVVRVRNMLEKLNIDCTESSDGIYIGTLSENEEKDIENLSENRLEFSVDGETYGIYGQNCILSCSDGYLEATALSPDTALYLVRNIGTSDYNTLRVGVKYREGLDLSNPQLFYQTSGMTSYTAECCINGEYVNLNNVKDGDTVEALFRLTEKNGFEGSYTAFRIDPFDPKQDFSVDYIRFENDGVYAELMNSPDYTFVSDENQWDFGKDSLDGFEFLNCEKSVIEYGFAKLIPSAEDTAIIRSVYFPSDSYQMMVIGIRYNEAMRSALPELYYTTDGDVGFSAEKMVKGSYEIPVGAVYGDTINAVFDMRNVYRWKGNVTSIRFDPYSALTPYEICFIRMCTAPDLPKVEIPLPTKPTSLVINSDCILPDEISANAVNARLTVEQDPKENGKKVFGLHGTGSENYYTYLNFSMQFESGKTYTVSYRIYPLKDALGNSYTNTVIASTFMYGTLSDRSIQNHRVGDDVKISEGDGWVDVTREFTVDEDYYPSENDSFTFWGTPANGNEISFLVSDINVSVKQS